MPIWRIFSKYKITIANERHLGTDFLMLTLAN